ncbi:hypothetical protein [Geotalea sp. SG265]|uniref:hypothetical protein n=1 Tax=Geotalea sp. SG265 TaxID=2922867 RepID=UPI001FB0182D|nr:hypothetical protein [Geotalea sp. SG265]
MKRYERRQEALLPRSKFLWRLFRHGMLASIFIVASLAVGIVGYRHFEGMPWTDAFVNAAMILGGMGPVGELHSEAGKLFAGLYALYSGLIAIIAVGIMAAPILHRFLHRFHLEADRDV